MTLDDALKCYDFSWTGKCQVSTRMNNSICIALIASSLNTRSPISIVLNVLTYNMLCHCWRWWNWSGYKFMRVVILKSFAVCSYWVHYVEHSSFTHHWTLFMRSTRIWIESTANTQLKKIVSLYWFDVCTSPNMFGLLFVHTMNHHDSHRRNICKPNVY